MQAKIEKKIAEALQKGTLQSHNWDTEPLLMDVAAKSSSNHGTNKRTHGNYNNKTTFSSVTANNHSYYGPSQGATSISTGNKTDNSSYYGNVKDTTSSSPPPSSQFPPLAISSLQKQSGKKKNKSKKRGLDKTAFNDDEDFVALPLSSSYKKGKKKQKHNGAMNHPGLDVSQQTLAKRANRFSGPGGIQEASSSGLSGSFDDHDKYMGKRLIGGSGVVLDETDFEKMTIKGEATTLEKEYLRLTAPPRAELVRPLTILKQHLTNLKREYYLIGDESGRNNEDTLLAERERQPQDDWGVRKPRRRHDYLWFCSQLKAVRQDCTVQRIQDEFAVDVYETHARIALQENDLNE